MDNNYEFLVDNPDAFNKAILDAIINEGEGWNKQASDISSGNVRRRLRENGFMRNILPIRPTTEFTRIPGIEDNLVVVDEMEPDQPGAVNLPLNDSHITHYFRGEGFYTSFTKITSPEWVKNIHELKVYRKIDLQKVLIDNALKDLQTREDAYFLGWVDTIVGSSAGNGAAGYKQNFDYTAGGAQDPNSGSGATITRGNYRKYTLNHLQDRDLNNGNFLVNRHTWTEFLDFDRTELGGDMAQETFLEGTAAFTKARLFGVNHIATIKRGLVGDGEVYQFAEPDFLGKAYSIKEPTMYVERKKDLLRTSVEEIIGMTIANVAAVNKVAFEVS